MKKFFSFLLITFLLACSISYTPSFANPVPLPNWSDPGITEIINLSDLTGWMQNGGVFDVSNFDNAEDFLTWYFQIRVPYIDNDGSIQSAPAFGNNTFNLTAGNMSFTDITNPRGVISNSFREHTGYGRSFQSDFENYSLTGGNLIDMPFQLQDRRSIGNFNLYRYDSLTNYLQNFEFDGPTPNPDPTYEALCYMIASYSIGNINENKSLVDYPIYTSSNVNESYHVYIDTPCTLYSSGGFGQFGLSSYSFFAIDHLSIYYNSTDKSITYSNTGGQKFIWNNNNYNYLRNIHWSDNTQSWNDNGWNASTQTLPDFPITSESVSTFINTIFQRFRHANVYVDGELWVYSGENSNNVRPEFPDAVGGEELPVTTWPLHLPKAPAYISGTGIINAIQRAINTDGTFDFGDLQDEITDSDGNPFPINDWEEIPFGDTIPNPNPDDDSVTGTPTPPIPDPDIIPIIPEPIHNAFQGTTILAELVDATQTALPSELITVFWGIVFILFILGIIKILHK